MNNGEALLKKAPNNWVKIIKKNRRIFCFFGSEECEEHQNMEKNTEYFVQLSRNNTVPF